MLRCCRTHQHQLMRISLRPPNSFSSTTITTTTNIPSQSQYQYHTYHTSSNVHDVSPAATSTHTGAGGKPLLSRYILAGGLYHNEHTPSEIDQVIREWLCEYTVTAIDIHSMLASCHKHKLLGTALHILNYCIPYQLQSLTNNTVNNTSIDNTASTSDIIASHGELLTPVSYGMIVDLAATALRHIDVHDYVLLLMY